MGRLVKKNTPADVVVVVRSALVLRLVTVTVASGTIASLESVTVPEMVPVISWALRGKGARVFRRTSAKGANSAARDTLTIGTSRKRFAEGLASCRHLFAGRATLRRL